MIPELDECRPGLRPPRFGLGTLMTVVSAFALMFTLMHYVGMLGSVIALLFLLCVLAHVAGNAIGTQLRDVGDQSPPDSKLLNRHGRYFGVAPCDFAPETRLRERYSLGKRNLAITILGSVVAGTLGGLGLWWLSGPRATWQGIALGFSASAVLGGIWTFAAASFIQVLLGAWFHAAKDSGKQ